MWLASFINRRLNRRQSNNLITGRRKYRPQLELLEDRTLLSGGGSGIDPLYTLASFNGTNGSNPSKCTLLMDASGNLYGTTQKGGAGGNGTVFELADFLEQSQPEATWHCPLLGGGCVELTPGAVPSSVPFRRAG